MKVKLESAGISANLILPDRAYLHQVEPADQTTLESALADPLGLPPISQCVVPGDRVVFVIDPETPRITETICSVWEQLQTQDMAELDITLLFPADSTNEEWKSIVEEIPIHIRHQASLKIHDPEDEQQRRYLASSAGGERIYLSEHLIDADLIITIGVIGFDTLLGYHGTNSAIYPPLSDAETIRAARGLGHVELTPDEKRPLRDLVDEIGWLLGTQFTVQIVPDSSGGIAEVFCGAADQVMAKGQQSLKTHWQFCVDDSTELTVISLPQTLPQFAWKQLAAATHAAAQIVEDGGRIAVIAELPEPSGPGIEMLRRTNEPDDLLKPLSMEPPEDAVEVIQLIQAQQRAQIFLLSRLSGTLVEELGIVPVSGESELQRLIDSADHVAVIPAAHYSWGQIAVHAT